MELWIPITIAGAFFQNLRSALQKYLKGRLSTMGATYVRFLYAMPFAIMYLAGLHYIGGKAFPEPNLTFLMYCVLGGLSQIAFTALLMWLFAFRNFAVGTTFSKTETAQVALLGLVILGDTLTLVSVFAIAVSVVGVMALSVAQTNITFRNLFASLTEKSTVIGLTSGLALGASVVFYRGATLALGDGDFIMRAAYALTISVIFQSVIMGIYLVLREPGQMTAVFKAWVPAGAVGIAGNLGSICWFSAFALQNAAYVRAVGQIELVFTFIASVFFFKEKTTRLEYAGIALVVAGILILVLGR